MNNGHRQAAREADRLLADLARRDAWQADQLLALDELDPAQKLGLLQRGLAVVDAAEQRGEPVDDELRESLLRGIEALQATDTTERS